MELLVDHEVWPRWLQVGHHPGRRARHVLARPFFSRHFLIDGDRVARVGLPKDDIVGSDLHNECEDHSHHHGSGERS